MLPVNGDCDWQQTLPVFCHSSLKNQLRQAETIVVLASKTLTQPSSRQSMRDSASIRTLGTEKHVFFFWRNDFFVPKFRSRKDFIVLILSAELLYHRPSTKTCTLHVEQNSYAVKPAKFHVEQHCHGEKAVSIKKIRYQKSKFFVALLYLSDSEWPETDFSSRTALQLQSYFKAMKNLTDKYKITSYFFMK